jgi:hypothetical protein
MSCEQLFPAVPHPSELTSPEGWGEIKTKLGTCNPPTRKQDTEWKEKLTEQILSGRLESHGDTSGNYKSPEEREKQRQFINDSNTLRIGEPDILGRIHEELNKAPQYRGHSLINKIWDAEIRYEMSQKKKGNRKFFRPSKQKLQDKAERQLKKRGTPETNNRVLLFNRNAQQIEHQEFLKKNGLV